MNEILMLKFFVFGVQVVITFRVWVFVLIVSITAMLIISAIVYCIKRRKNNACKKGKRWLQVRDSRESLSDKGAGGKAGARD